MTVFKFAVCDDDKAALAAVSGAIVNVFKNNGAVVTVDSYMPSPNLFNRLKEQDYNAVFLDINMPEMDGIRLAKQLKESRGEMDIVFVSGEEDRVFESFAVHPYGFIRKSKFLKDIGGLAKMYIADRSETDETMVELKSNNVLYKVKLNDVVYIESIREYQYVYMNVREEPKKIRSTMEILEKQLTPLGFIRIHKGYLVNYCYIRRIESADIVTTTEVRLPISRRRGKNIWNSAEKSVLSDWDKTDLRKFCLSKKLKKFCFAVAYLRLRFFYRARNPPAMPVEIKKL